MDARGRSSDGEELTAEELAAWQGMLATTIRLRRQLDEELRADHELTIADYDVLVRLASGPAEGMRMAALAATAFQPKSSLTRIAAGLECRGLVRREPHPTDRRGARLVLTAAGERAFRAAQHDHLRRVRASFLDRLSDRRLRELAAAWDEVGIAEPPG